MSSSKSKIPFHRFHKSESSQEKSLLKSKKYKPLKQESFSSSSSSSSNDDEEEKGTVEKQAIQDLRQAIRDRELAELRLEKKLRQEVIRLEKERKLDSQLNVWQQEDNQR
jgi:hypothetical protein